MTLRRRLALISGLAVAVAVAVASLIVWFVVRGDLHSQVDSSLRDLAQGARVAPAPLPRAAGGIALRIRPHRSGGPAARPAHRPRFPKPFLALPRQPPGVPSGYGQVVTASGRILRPAGNVPALPMTAAAREVAAGQRGPFFSDAEIHGSHLRVLTQQIAPGRAVQVARSLDDVDATMRTLAIVLAAVTLTGAALAALAGRAISRAALGPVAELTEIAEHVAETRDLGSRIEVPDRGDEVSRLAASFNAMLAELDEAITAQRRLVADASHELRTPLTSARTNLEVLARENGFGEAERSALIEDVVTQLGELSTLVSDLVELARDEGKRGARDGSVQFDELVAAAVERARRMTRDVQFEAELAPCLVRGDRGRLDRAVANLLDNAAKWSPAGTEVEVKLSRAGELTVRDRGPGIDPVDLPYVFDRFYRSADSRGMPGSGLGLAIVREIARAHGGSVEAKQAAGGGTLLRLRIPAANLLPDSSAALS